MIDTGRFRIMAMSISPTIVLSVLAIVIMGLLVLPFVKIRRMGHREELRNADVAILMAATIVAASIWTFTTLFGASHRLESNATERNLENLAGRIDSALALESNQVLATLDSLTTARQAFGHLAGYGFQQLEKPEDTDELSAWDKWNYGLGDARPTDTVSVPHRHSSQLRERGRSSSVPRDGVLDERGWVSGIEMEYSQFDDTSREL